MSTIPSTNRNILTSNTMVNIVIPHYVRPQDKKCSTPKMTGSSVWGIAGKNVSWTIKDSISARSIISTGTNPVKKADNRIIKAIYDENKHSPQSLMWIEYRIRFSTELVSIWLNLNDFQTNWLLWTSN